MTLWSAKAASRWLSLLGASSPKPKVQVACGLRSLNKKPMNAGNIKNSKKDVVQPDVLNFMLTAFMVTKIHFFVVEFGQQVKPLSSTSQQSLQLQKGEMVQLHLRLQVGLFVGWFNDEG